MSFPAAPGSDRRPGRPGRLRSWRDRARARRAGDWAEPDLEEWAELLSQVKAEVRGPG